MRRGEANAVVADPFGGPGDVRQVPEYSYNFELWGGLVSDSELRCVITNAYIVYISST